MFKTISRTPAGTSQSSVKTGISLPLPCQYAWSIVLLLVYTLSIRHGATLEDRLKDYRNSALKICHYADCTVLEELRLFQAKRKKNKRSSKNGTCCKCKFQPRKYCLSSEIGPHSVCALMNPPISTLIMSGAPNAIFSFFPLITVAIVFQILLFLSINNVVY